MAIEKLTKIVSSAIPINIENIDTDQIIPARFLKAVERKGFGDNLFRDWRYDKQGEPIAGFPLNDPRFGGSVLVAAKNFGCGSSREHAAWALYDFGLRIIVSSFFADIFRNNALNCGLLPITVSEKFLNEAFETIGDNPDARFDIDLPAQTIANTATGTKESFEIDGYKKECLLNGFDDVDYLKSIAPEIEKFENE